MAITYTATKNSAYGASASSSDPYFTYQSPNASGYGAALSVTSITGASITAINSNGSSATNRWHMEIQVNIGGNWYSLGYIDAGGKKTGSITMSTFYPYDLSSSLKSLMGKNQISGLRGRVINGYFYVQTSSQMTLTMNTSVDYTAVTAPTTVGVSSTNVKPSTSVTLSWSGASNGVSNAITKYEIYRSTTSASSGFTLLGSSTSNSFAVTSPASNGSYWYKVRSIGSVSGYDSGQSSATATLTTATSAVGTPTGVKVSETNVPPSKSVTLSWTAPSGGTNNPVTGYRIERSTNGSSWAVLITSQTGTTLAVTAPASNGSYYYRVIALGTYGNSGESASVSLTTSWSAPSTPGGVKLSVASVGASGGSTLSWNASSNGTNNAITGYRIERSTSASGTFSAIVSSQTGTSLAVIGQASNNTSYFYRVIALAPHGNSAVSAVVELKTQWSAPSTPGGLTLSANDVSPSQSVTLSWNASSNGTNNVVSGYRIERSTSAGSGFTVLVSSQTARTLAVTARDATGQSYFYRVVALAPQQNSAVSAVIELKTSVGSIAAPTNLLLNAATSSTVSPVTSVNLTWTGSPDGQNNAVTGYIVYEATSAAGNYVQIATTAKNVTTYAIVTPASEGTRYYKVAAKGTYSNSSQTGYVSITVSLTTAEASTFSNSPTTLNAGTKLTVTITPSNMAYSHKVTLTFGDKTTGAVTIAAGTKTWEYTIPLEWLTAIPHSLSGTGTVTLETYSGTTLKGRRSSNIVVTVPSDVTPSLASFTGDRVNNGVPVAWGLYVVGKSQVDLVMGAGSGAYGSTISSYRLQGGGMNISNTAPISQRSPVITSTSTAYTATVTDSRGRSKTYTLTITAEAYGAPTLSTVTYRCLSNGVESDDGTYGYARANVAFSSVQGKNSVVITSDYRVRGSGSAFTTISNGMVSGTGITFGSGAISKDKYYEVRYTVTDAVGTSVTFSDDIPIAMYIFHFKNNGLAFGIGGPSSTDNTIDAHWKIKTYGGLSDYSTGAERPYLHSGNWSTYISIPSSTWASITGKPSVFPTDWASVSGKPTSFPPEIHSHTKAQITDFPTSMPASDVYAWAKAATPDGVNLSNNDSIKLAVSGGTNMILNSGFTSNLAHWTGGTRVLTEDPFGSYGIRSGVIASGSNTVFWATDIPIGSIYTGNTYTLGFWINGSESCDAFVCNKNGSVVKVALSAMTLKKRVGNWRYFEKTGVANSNDLAECNVLIRAFGAGFAITLSRAMLSQGTMATDWSPSPQDKLDVGANAASATKLATARTFTIGNTGKTFDGSANVSWTLAEIGAAASSHSHSYLPLSGGRMTGTLELGVASGGSAALRIMNTTGDLTTLAIVDSSNVLNLGHNTALSGLRLRAAGADAGSITTRRGSTTYTNLDSGNYNSYAQKKITYGTAAPSGGVDGDIYIQY